LPGRIASVFEIVEAAGVIAARPEEDCRIEAHGARDDGGVDRIRLSRHGVAPRRWVHTYSETSRLQLDVIGSRHFSCTIRAYAIRGPRQTTPPAGRVKGLGFEPDPDPPSRQRKRPALGGTGLSEKPPEWIANGSHSP
jgi:hypothetical protein